MKRFVQPTTGLAFTLQSDGTVAVEDPARQLSGVFTRAGEWVSGDLRYADEVMCEFVGGAFVPSAQKVQEGGGHS